jgi:hypothetical protein
VKPDGSGNHETARQSIACGRGKANGEPLLRRWAVEANNCR